MSVAWQANFDKHARKAGDLQVFLDQLRNENEHYIDDVDEKAAVNRLISQFEERLDICKKTIADAYYHMTQMAAQLDFIEDDELLYGYGARLQIVLEELENVQTMWEKAIGHSFDKNSLKGNSCKDVVENIFDEIWWML